MATHNNHSMNDLREANHMPQKVFFRNNSLVKIENLQAIYKNSIRALYANKTKSNHIKSYPNQSKSQLNS